MCGPRGKLHVLIRLNVCVTNNLRFRIPLFVKQKNSLSECADSERLSSGAREAVDGTRGPLPALRSSYYFRLTVFVSGLKVNCIVFNKVTPCTAGNDEFVLLPLGAMPAGKYCLLAMLTCVGPLTKPVTR